MNVAGSTDNNGQFSRLIRAHPINYNGGIYMDKMKRSFASIVLACTVATILALGGCGVETIPPPTASPTPGVVSGVAAVGKSIQGMVTLKDSSSPSKIRTTITGPDGSYQFKVDGLKPPFVLKVQWKDENAVTLRLHSLARKHGKANINPLSDVILAGAGADDPTLIFDTNDPASIQAAAEKLMAALQSLRTVLAPMFQLYGIEKDPIEDDFEADHTGLDALFDDVRIYAASGMIIVRNKRTNGLIFSAPINDIASGTFYENNLPVQPGTLNGASLYANKCASCHGALAPGKKGATAAEIQAAIAANTGGMGTLSSLTALEIQAIATFLAPGAPEPSACTYTYDLWGACQSDNTQSRIMLTSAPAGCTGTPVLTQACTYVPGPSSCSYTYNAWGACQSNGTQTRTLATSSPAGCVGIPVLSQTCTYVPPVTTCSSFTYSAWGACQSDNTQTRTQLTASPAGCTGGTPVLSQSCTYVPPVTTCSSFTYSAWGSCQSDNTQTRTQLTASPAGCTGGTPVLTQSCTYVPPVSTCGSCHAIPPSTGKHAFHYPSRVSSCSTCHGTGYTPTAVTATTHMNGVSNIVSSMNYNATTGTCGSPGCHGSKTW
jgi:hypothetical protein